VIKRKEAVTDMSDIMKAENESRERKARVSQRMQDDAEYNASSNDDDGDEVEAVEDDIDDLEEVADATEESRIEEAEEEESKT